jgi:hypothetical protein
LSKFTSPIPLCWTYQMTPLSARSISMDGTSANINNKLEKKSEFSVSTVQEEPDRRSDSVQTDRIGRVKGGGETVHRDNSSVDRHSAGIRRRLEKYFQSNAQIWGSCHLHQVSLSHRDRYNRVTTDREI